MKSDGTSGMAGSYNTNSLPQLSAIQSSISCIQRAVDALKISASSTPLILADFGCSHGANSVYVMKTIIDQIQRVHKTEQAFLVIHNDLPTNDWTALFNILSEEKFYYGLANGCSFYSPCLPSNTVTMSHSSSAIHWLSRKPCNIPNHCLSLFARDEPFEAFREQAHADYIQFLQHRARELLPGGVLILGILCVEDQDQHSEIERGYDLLYKCAQLLPMNEQELLDYTIPMYRRTFKECCDEDALKQCSFRLVHCDRFLTKSNVYQKYQQGEMTLDQFVDRHTEFIQSWSESALKQTLQSNGNRSLEEVDHSLNRFWALYRDEVRDKPHEHDRSSWQTVLVLQKI